MFTAVVVPPARKRSPDLQNYAAQEWGAQDAFLQKEFANQVQNDAMKRGTGEQTEPVKWAWRFRWGRSFPQHK